jgi:hypothetical protein
MLIHNGDHLESILSGEAKPMLYGNMDAQCWTEEWLRITKEKPGIPQDKACMTGWFANAIMTGYDIGADKGYRQSKDDQSEPTDYW